MILSTKQYSCLENPMDGEAREAPVHGVARSRTRLSDFTPLWSFTSGAVLAPLGVISLVG